MRLKPAAPQHHNQQTPSSFQNPQQPPAASSATTDRVHKWLDNVNQNNNNGGNNNTVTSSSAVGHVAAKHRGRSVDRGHGGFKMPSYEQTLSRSQLMQQQESSVPMLYT